ncbi:MAG: hypothetical protein ABIQ11_11390 [Saprospiraceae bacterium]
MKQFLFSLFFFSLMIVGAQAQSKAACSKTCTKSEAAACKATAPSTAMTSDVDYNVSASKLAANDPTIEVKTCPITGAVSYSRKETNIANGKVSLVDVSYDAASNSFLNVSPVKAEGTGTGCGSKATSVSSKSGCSTGAAQGKSCCPSKGAGVKTAEKVKS